MIYVMLQIIGGGPKYLARADTLMKVSYAICVITGALVR